MQLKLFDTKTYLLLLLLPVIATCSRQDGNETAAFKEHIVNKTEVFISTETSDFVGAPTRIKACNGGLCFSDHGFQRITKVDREGNRLLSFGRQGRGPGEFDSITGFWIFDDNYMVYDYNGLKFIMFDTEGNLVSEKAAPKNPVNPDGFPPQIPVTVHASSQHELLIPSRGRNGSLFALADVKTDELQYMGSAIGKHVESYDSENVRRSFLGGEIPDIFVNAVVLASSSSGIYSFQQTTGVLEKYSYSGDLLWKKDLKIPAQSDLFDQIASHNRQSKNNSESTRLFYYARAIDAHEKGVAVLLNMPEGDPVTMAWVPDDGASLDVVTFRGLDQEKTGYQGSFSVSPLDKRIYFLYSREGLIYEAEWPV